MKKIYKIISTLLVGVILLCSCSAVVDTKTPTTNEETLTPTVKPTTTEIPTPIPTNLADIGQIVYADGWYGHGENSKLKAVTIPMRHIYRTMDLLDIP